MDDWKVEGKTNSNSFFRGRQGEVSLKTAERIQVILEHARCERPEFKLIVIFLMFAVFGCSRPGGDDVGRSLVSQEEPGPDDTAQRCSIWKKALEHRATPEIVNAVLTDWLRKERLSGKLVCEHPPNLEAVRIRAKDMPHDFVPVVPGVGFKLVRKDAEVYGNSVGDIGLRFDEFVICRKKSIRVVFRMYQYSRRDWLGGVLRITYRMHKKNGVWVAVLHETEW